MSAARAFRATEVTPSGIAVTVLITASEESYGKDVRELAEVAQMSASRTVGQIEDAIARDAARRMPF